LNIFSGQKTIQDQIGHLKNIYRFAVVVNTLFSPFIKI